MKHIFTVLLAVLTLSVIGHLQSITAQNPDITPSQSSYVGSHTLCTLSVAGSSKVCQAADGVWVSENGAAYYKLGPASSGGVTSFNGLTGAVTSASAGIKYSELVSTPVFVNTVNGKKPDANGDVTLAATTTVATPSASTTLK